MRPDKKGAHRSNYERNKKRILATQNICGICGKPVDMSLKHGHPMAPTIDHIIPVNGPGGLRGHPSDLSNLQLSHAGCNRQKSDKIFRNKEVFEPVVLGNRNLPQSMDWKAYRSD
ncbi:MAG TPA: HNH endonuclease signature motif containing protein [Bacillota bacterium]|nr:HNH endonuclease signature motif containing protein [Bacillota bacterium]